MLTTAMIVEALAGRQLLRERSLDYSAVVSRTRERLPYAALAAIAKRYGIPLASLARVIGLPEPILARRKKTRRLSANESTRLLRVARVATSAEDVLRARTKAGRWLQAPNVALGGAIPLDLLDTALGAEEVAAILGQMEHGIYS